MDGYRGLGQIIKSGAMMGIEIFKYREHTVLTLISATCATSGTNLTMTVTQPKIV